MRPHIHQSNNQYQAAAAYQPYRGLRVVRRDRAMQRGVDVVVLGGETIDPH